MSNDTIDYGRIIKHLRKKFNLTQSELGEKIAVGKTAISNYETGYSIPSANIMTKIASVFGMSLIEFLLCNDEENGDFSLPRLKQPINDVVIPYIKEINIAETVLNSKKYMDSYLTLPGFMLESGDEHICIKVRDDSMDGDNINKNDYVIIRKSEHIPDNKIVLAIYRPTGEHILRRYLRENHIITLIPSSSSQKYSIIRCDERFGDVVIIGYVEKTINNR